MRREYVTYMIFHKGQALEVHLDAKRFWVFWTKVFVYTLAPYVVSEEFITRRASGHDIIWQASERIHAAYDKE